MCIEYIIRVVRRKGKFYLGMFEMHTFNSLNYFSFKMVLSDEYLVMNW